ncbi:mCG10576, isoform CRA_a, partial [Mus musculus]
PGASSPEECELCPSGYYCPDAQVTGRANVFAIPCQPGSECPAGAVGMVPCRPGSYCGPRTGVPPLCPGGFACPPGSSTYSGPGQHPVRLDSSAPKALRAITSSLAQWATTVLRGHLGPGPVQQEPLEGRAKQQHLKNASRALRAPSVPCQDRQRAFPAGVPPSLPQVLLPVPAEV